MAGTKNAGDPTLLDMVTRTDPNGSIAKIVESLSKKNAIIEDAVAMEGNLPTGHRFTTRNTNPAVSWRRYNDGIVPSKSTTGQFDEVCGMLEGMSYVDCGLAKLNGNEAAFRASEDSSFLQSMSIEAARALMYASTTGTTPEQIQGLSPRFNLLAGQTGTGAPNGVGQIVNMLNYDGLAARDTVDASSMWFVCWGSDTAYLIYPKGQNGGFQSEDLGKQIVDAGSSKKYTAWVTHWMWNLGLCIQDQRQVVRICNWDASLYAAATTANKAIAQKGLIDAMIAAYYRLYDPMAGRLVIYCNRTIAELLHRGAMEKATFGLSIGEYAGKPVTTFLGFPIRIVDALTAIETHVA